MSRYIATGALVGILFGIILPIIFPNLGYLDFLFKILFNKQIGYAPDYYSVKNGSVLAGGGLILVLCVIIGALVGAIVFKIRRVTSK